ncbi:unnamed protein product [Ceratitis capitata]|uniref:(Mediterranean fruit fly) hypothetical protein n=1 Tax=Ceratitis capitata TaxID=7213 RepID=A0A811VJT7_CERCA|nr:unnamed protein product [Ceratitis capitata]
MAATQANATHEEATPNRMKNRRSDGRGDGRTRTYTHLHENINLRNTGFHLLGNQQQEQQEQQYYVSGDKQKLGVTVAHRKTAFHAIKTLLTRRMTSQATGVVG